MELKFKYDGKCPCCLSLLKNKSHNKDADGFNFNIASCHTKTCIAYTSLSIVKPGHPYHHFIYDREFIVKKVLLNVNYYREVTSITPLNNLVARPFPFFDFDWSNRPSIENKVKTLLTFG